jgi:hypothetical protein
LVAGYRQEALKIKQEYHSFRSKIAQLMLLFASVLMFAMWHSASAAAEDADVQHGTFAVIKGVLRHSFSPIIMVGVQVCAPVCHRRTGKLSCSAHEEADPGMLLCHLKHMMAHVCH